MWRRVVAIILVLIPGATPALLAADGEDPVDPTVVYWWPHGLVDVNNKTALVRWAMEAAPGRYELGVVSGRSTFHTQIVDDHTARLLLKDPDFGTRQFIMTMEPIYGPDPAECAPSSGIHREGRFIVTHDGCEGVPDTLRGGVIAREQRPSFVMGGQGLAWFPATGAYHVGSDIMAGMFPFFEAVGLRDTEALVVDDGTPLGNRSLAPPRATYSCTCTQYRISSEGPFTALDAIYLTVDENQDLVQVQIGPRVDRDQTPVLPHTELDAKVAAFAADHDLVVDEVGAWRIDRTTGGLNRSVDFTYSGLWAHAGEVEAAQQAHDGAIVVHQRYAPYGMAYVSPLVMTIVAVLAASLLVFWGWRT